MRARTLDLRRALLWASLGWLLVSLLLWLAIGVAPHVGSGLLLVEYVPPLLCVAFSLLLFAAAAWHRLWLTLFVAGVATMVMAGPIAGGAVHFALPARSDDVSVVSFNVAKWWLGFDGVLNALERAAPDVFCLQEAGIYDWDPRAREKDLELHARFAKYELVREGELLVGSRLPVVGKEWLALPENPASRPLLSVTLRLPEGGLMTVMAAHLIYTHAFPSTLSGLLHAAEARRQQARTIRRYADSLNTPLVLCGDFNTAPPSAVITELGQGLDEAFQERGFGFGMSTDSGLIARRLDYVFVRGLSVRQARFLPPGGSDHLPFRVVLGPR